MGLGQSAPGMGERLRNLAFDDPSFFVYGSAVVGIAEGDPTNTLAAVLSEQGSGGQGFSAQAHIMGLVGRSNVIYLDPERRRRRPDWKP